MIDLRSARLIDFVPESIASDPEVVALCAALDPQMQAVSSAIVEAIILPRIAELEEPVLDAVAWGFKLDRLRVWDVAQGREADVVVLSDYAKGALVNVSTMVASARALGKQVLVTGCGPIGSLLIGALRRAGATRIVAADIADLPLKCAKEVGADETINLKTQAEALDKYKVDKGQFDAVFEASGSEAALRVGLDTIVPRGVLITVGMGGDISLPMTQIVAKEVDLRGTFRFHAEFATAVRFLNEGLVNGKPVITGILPVERAIEAFDLAADKSQSLKVQISFQNA